MSASSCSRCGHENRADARFCLGCGAKLGLACPACERELPPGASFCDGCGERIGTAAATTSSVERAPRDYTPKHLTDKILQSHSAIEGERKQLTVLFADVKGSLELSEELDPEVWHEILDKMFGILTDGVHRFEGTVNQYTGDGIMALFGAPIAHEDHARRACYAALHLLDELRAFTQELRRTRGLDFSVRIGLHSGEVIVGKIGDDLRMDYTAQGHTVGLAARLESLAEAGRAYLSEATAEQVKGFFELEDLERFQVKGVSEGVHAYALLGVGSLRTRFDQSRARGLTRFVGRDDDMQTLDAALARARAGEGGIVAVVADAGIGKSRLCFQFLENCRAADLPVVSGSAVAHGQHIPYLPILEVMRDFFEISDRDDDRAVRQKVAGRLLLLDESYRAVLPVLFDFLGVPDPTNPAEVTDNDLRQRQLFGVLRRLLESGTAEAPGVALIEDLHWIDGGTQAWIEEWSEAITGTHNVLLVNFRPEYQSDWMQRSTVRQLPIQPLGAEAIRELLDDLLGADPSVAGLADAVYARTGGNPFYTEEVVRSLAESGHLEGAKGGYRLVTSIDDLPVPESVQALLAARIDRLPEREKRTLQVAAVIGKEFTESILLAVADLPSRELGESMAALRSGEFVLEQALYPEAEYRFVHPLTQQVAYESQLSQRRSEVHTATAQAIEARYSSPEGAEKLDEQAALLAHHWERGGNALAGARWHVRAAEWVAKTRLPEARDHYHAAVTLLRDFPFSEESARLGIAARIGTLQMGWRIGLPGDVALELLESGLALARRTDDPRAEVLLRLPYAVHCSVSGDEWGRLEHSGKALEQARAAGDEELILSSIVVYVSSLLELGRPLEAIPLLDAILESTPDDPELGNAYWGFNLFAFLVGSRAGHNALVGSFEQARADLAQEWNLVRAGDSPEGMWFPHANQGKVEGLAGDGAQAVYHGERALEQSEHLGAVHRLISLQTIARGKLAARDLEGVREVLEPALEMAEREGTPGLLYTLLAARIAVAAERDDYEEAERLAASGVEQLAGYDLYPNEARIALARARVQSGGDAAAIEALLAEARTGLEAAGLRAPAVEIHEVRAELALRAGDAETARTEREEAHRLYTEMGAEGHAARLAAQLS